MTSKRIIISGTAISSGIALGRARVLVPGKTDVTEISVPVSAVKGEILALDRAVEETVAELKQLRDSAGKKMGGPVAKIFDAQLLIASDAEFLKSVRVEIETTRRNAGSAYNSLMYAIIEPLKRSTDPHMSQMSLDIEAVARKVLAHLQGNGESLRRFSPNTILVGKMFTPGEILTYRQRKAIGFVAAEGGSNSHMALIARGLMLPAAVNGDAFGRIPDGCRLILDGSNGVIIVNPTDADWSEYQRKKKRFGPVLIRRIRKLPEIPPKTKDGKTIGIGANLSLPGPADDILAERQIPVGLYRTEFLYIAENAFPSEDAQFEYYSAIAEKFARTTVVLRTFDLGYDKISRDRIWMTEDNPALGWRGIRPMLDMTDIFKTQIRAMLRASTRKNIKIMLPMITDVSEVVRARKMISQVKFKLRKEKIEFDSDIEVGIMVEVPAAALAAEALAPKVDFMSIGTNDLTQYTLAADRMNSRVAGLYSAFHPSVLTLIKKTVDACKSHKIPVSICGEVAGDLLGVPLFIGMGVDMLSMNPSRMVDFCRMVRKIDYNLVHHMVQSVIESGSLAAATSQLERFQPALEQTKH